MRFFITFAVSDLDERSETSDFYRYTFSCGRVGAEDALAYLVFETHIEGFVDIGVENIVETADFVDPCNFAFCDVVEAFFDVCGEVVIKNCGEI